MTTVVAIARDGHVHMAADSLVNVYERPVIGGVRKILRLTLAGEDVLLGVSGTAAMPGVLEADLELDEAPDLTADPQLFATRVARAVTRVAAAEGLLSEGRLDAHLILGWRGHVWSLNHSMAIAHSDGVAAIGSGEGPAIGAADALLGRGVNPIEALVEALHIGIHRDKHSAYPLQVETLPPPPLVAGGCVPRPAWLDVTDEPPGNVL